MIASRSVRHRLNRALIAIATVAGGCSLFSGREPEATYTLVRVSGQPLPATVAFANVVDGSTYAVEAVRGTLRLYAGGRFERERDLRDVRNGVPADTLNCGCRYSGSFERNDTTLVTRFFDERGGPEVFRYEILNDGLVLRGQEGIVGMFGRIYEYRRD